jgi:RNA polymerase sigma-70 factor (ECF subfamily)
VTTGDDVTSGDAADYDVVLLKRHLSGDPDAFTEIVRRHRDQLWAVALRTTCDAEEAADALQDALISAMRHAASFRGDAKLSTWLHRIVVNACLDRLRRRASHPTTTLPDDDHAPTTARDEFADRDVATDVHAALATLPADQRAALVLVDIEGYPVDQVAAMLEVPAGTIKSRCARGRAKLVPLLAHLREGQQLRDEPGNPTLRAAVLPDVETTATEPPTTEPPTTEPPTTGPPTTEPPTTEPPPREELR